MKPFIVFLLASFMMPAVYSQDTSVYRLPDAFNFDYTLSQTASGKKPGENRTYHFYFTKSGEYAAAEWSSSENKRGNLLIVLTRVGNIVVLNNREKNVTILNTHKLMADMMGMLRWVRMDSLMAHLRSRSDSSDFHSAKTGRTKPLNNYTAVEYDVTRHRHKGSVWIANVDFPTISDYFASFMRTGMMPMGKRSMEDGMATHPLLQALMQPKTLITEIEMSDSTGNRGFNLQTLSLLPTRSSVSLQGFAVSDYSNMTLREIFEAEMKRRNN
ncbi:MAG: hypothetical protein C5B59_19540 [Bacteroidetes bacterium]|nr:MAG: hypothetical protein C5B59_19540 [Bacteroidota bacterium]